MLPVKHAAKKTILVFTFALDVEHPIFAHQAYLIDRLAKSFKKVIVITNQVGIYRKKRNVDIYDLNWQEKRPIRNTLVFRKRLKHVLSNEEVDITFSHMTTVLSLLSGLLLKKRKISHILWYAHAKNSLILKFTSKLVDRILTSTTGSFPFPTRKLSVIGQGIDTNQFFYRGKKENKFSKFFHVGRIDESKNIHGIIKFFLNIPKKNKKLYLIGSPSGNKKSTLYHNQLKNNYMNNKNIIFVGSLPRSELYGVINKFDCFLHMYQGSLDKTLVEATIIGIPVITANSEYIREFGSWAKDNESNYIEQYKFVTSMKISKLNSILKSKSLIAKKNHSFEVWYKKLLKTLIH